MIVLLMGVSGSGKTTVGEELAHDLGWELIEGDELHAPASIARMASGIPLDDAARAPWLQSIRAVIDRLERDGRSAVITCSALKQQYRDVLLPGTRDVRLVHLRASRALLQARLEQRQGHFMKAGMLASQLADLEEPGAAITVDASESPDAIVRRIEQELGLR